MEFETWLSSVSPALPSRELRILRLAGETLYGNILRARDDAPLPWGELRVASPSTAVYHGVWNWDSCFHARGFAHWDVALAREQIEWLFRTQRPDGCFIDCWEKGGAKCDYLSKPPVIFDTYARLDRLDPDDVELARVYPQLVACEAFWRTKRCDDGLFFYAGDAPAGSTPEESATYAKWESGWDNSPRFDGGITDRLYAVDLNAYMVTAYRALTYLATRLGKAEDADLYASHASALAGRMEEVLWSEGAQAYCDAYRTPVSGRRTTDILTPASFMPLYVGVASQARAARMAALAGDPTKFYPLMPAVAYDHPTYTPDQYWRGPTWLNITCMALTGLKHYGYTRLAGEFRERLLGILDAPGGGMWEYFDSRTGRGLGAPRYGWTAAFAVELVLGE